MGPEIWAAIVGSLVLAGVTGVGILFWSHMTSAQRDANEAHEKAHKLEVTILASRVEHSEEIRKHERALLEHKLHVSNDFVRKSDHDNIVTEIFRKLENQDRQVAQGFSGLRSWLDTKFDTIASQLHTKADKP